MKRTILTLINLSAVMLAACALTACEGDADTLTDGRTTGGSRGTAGGEDSTFNHSNDSPAAPGADEQPPEPAQLRLMGSPEVTSRLHSCGKMTNTSLLSILESRGLGGGTPGGGGAQTARQIFDRSQAALGGPNYNGRVPEAPFASTSAMSKAFDIFAMASYAAVNANYTATACPDVKIVVDGKITKDGLTCLMGKPATDAHVALANDAITKNATDGAKIAIAAALAAAHTCQ